MGSTPQGREEIAEVVGIILDKQFPKFDISQYICEYRNFNLGDKPEFRLNKKGIRAYWIAPNSYVPKSRNYKTTLGMEFEAVAARPECLLDEIKAGSVENFVS
jgi:hypothetical protein